MGIVVTSSSDLSLEEILRLDLKCSVEFLAVWQSLSRFAKSRNYNVKMSKYETYTHIYINTSTPKLKMSYNK